MRFCKEIVLWSRWVTVKF